jgi:hypothetical protein
MRLIFIHGRAQGNKDPGVLKAHWESALWNGLRAGGLDHLSNVEVAFPFYGKRLDELVEILNSPLVEDVHYRGSASDHRETTFRGELLTELAEVNGISDADIQAHYVGKPHEKGILNWEWVQAILRALDQTPFGESAIDLFTRDAYVYLCYPNVRAEIDAIVAREIDQQACTVVGHSLGSVVGYNVLRKMGNQSNVQRYVTVGSPLGLRAIKRKLDLPLDMPQGVESWYNAYDEGDVVALLPLDDQHFPIIPEIENNNTVQNNTDNHHGIDGYLSDRNVALKIVKALVPD